MTSSLDLTGTMVALRDGVPIIESYGGLADSTTGEPCAAATRFQLASVSKQFTATAMRSVGQGRWLRLLHRPPCGGIARSTTPVTPGLQRAWRVVHRRWRG